MTADIFAHGDDLCPSVPGLNVASAMLYHGDAHSPMVSGVGVIGIDRSMSPLPAWLHADGNDGELRRPSSDVELRVGDWPWGPSIGGWIAARDLQ